MEDQPYQQGSLGVLSASELPHDRLQVYNTANSLHRLQASLFVRLIQYLSYYSSARLTYCQVEESSYDQ